MEKINKILNREINLLKDGVKNGKSPYHLFSLTTINKRYPETRTVVLRDVEVDPLKIFFNTDYRSPKIKDIQSNPFCSALFYDANRKVQLRLKCESVIHYLDDIAFSRWQKTALQSRKCYMGPFSPGSKIDKWHPNFPLDLKKKNPTKESSEAGYKNFSSIELKINELDILELHHDGHIRFQCSKEKNLFYVSP